MPPNNLSFWAQSQKGEMKFLDFAVMKNEIFFGSSDGVAALLLIAVV